MPADGRGKESHKDCGDSNSGNEAPSSSISDPREGAEMVGKDAAWEALKV